jgi:heat shock protein HtpX
VVFRRFWIDICINRGIDDALPKEWTEVKRNGVNRAQWLLYLALMAGLLAGIGGALFGTLGAVLTVVFAFGIFFLVPQSSVRWVLRQRGAIPLDSRNAPELARIIHRLAHRAGLGRAPRLFYLPSSVMNAFTTGSQTEPTIVLTSALLDNLSFREITGVLAHEVSHIGNNDLWILGVASSIHRFTLLLSMAGRLLLFVTLPLLLFGIRPFSFLAVLLMIAAPFISLILQRSLSRAREFEADRQAALMTEDPRGLARALRRLSGGGFSLWNYILIPRRRHTEGGSIFQSHPSVEERVRRLEAQAPRSYHPVLL